MQIDVKRFTDVFSAVIMTAITSGARRVALSSAIKRGAQYDPFASQPAGLPPGLQAMQSHALEMRRARLDHELLCPHRPSAKASVIAKRRLSVQHGSTSMPSIVTDEPETYTPCECVWAVLTVTDDAKGRTDVDASNIFKPFEYLRLGDAHDGALAGSGLSLVLFHRLVSELGGALWAASDPAGTGNMTCCVLPVNLKRARAEPESESHARSGRRSVDSPVAAEYSPSSVVGLGGDQSGLRSPGAVDTALAGGGLGPSDPRAASVQSADAPQLSDATVEPAMHPPPAEGSPIRVSAAAGPKSVTSEPAADVLMSALGSVSPSMQPDHQKAAADPAPAADHAALAPPATAAPVTVLIVDDVRSMRTLLRRTITGLLDRGTAGGGLRVEEAADGKEAVERALELRPTFILMDHRMPNMDGDAATSELRARGYDRPIFGVTGDALPGDVCAFRDAGATDVLIKPVTRTMLASALTASGLLPIGPPAPAADHASATREAS